MPIVQKAEPAPNIVVVMGAAVWPNGVPSKAMLRRVDSALANNSRGDSIFILSGGIGKNPPSEAEVMKQLLVHGGIDAAQIQLDEKSTDTLSSVRNCAGLVRRLRHSQVLVCSDSYHIPRCRWLFRLLGINTTAANILSGRASNGYVRWFSYYVREAFALPWDTLLLLLRRLRDHAE